MELDALDGIGGMKELTWRLNGVQGPLSIFLGCCRGRHTHLHTLDEFGHVWSVIIIHYRYLPVDRHYCLKQLRTATD